MGFLLWIVSNIIYYGLLPIVWVYDLFYYFYNRKFLKAFKEIDNDFFNVALGNDQKGNIVYKHLFNGWLITKDTVNYFGDEDETVSSVLGKNKLDQTLTRLGKAVCFILDSIDENHCIKSINK